MARAYTNNTQNLVKFVGFAADEPEIRVGNNNKEYATVKLAMQYEGWADGEKKTVRETIFFTVFDAAAVATAKRIGNGHRIEAMGYLERKQMTAKDGTTTYWTNEIRITTLMIHKGAQSVQPVAKPRDPSKEAPSVRR